MTLRRSGEPFHAQHGGTCWCCDWPIIPGDTIRCLVRSGLPDEPIYVHVECTPFSAFTDEADCTQ